MSELLSCPFCGGEAEWAKGKNGDGTDWDYIVCSMCEAIGPSASVQLEGKALDWNQRQPHVEILETREIRVMRNMAWERAKGELNSILCTYFEPTSTKFAEMDQAIKAFVDVVEGEALQE